MTFGTLPSSADFANGRVLREPAGAGPGYWIGCPGVYRDPASGLWVLTYRIRRPRGVAPERGGEIAIATSTDGARFDDIVRFTKDQFDTASLERSAVQRTADGLWHLFVSYVDPSDGRWCTAVLRGPDLGLLDPAHREVVFRASDVDLEGVKDPYLWKEGATTWMLLSVAVRTASTSASSHETLDIYNTGDCISATALASSEDLRNWAWHGVVFAPEGTGWDRYCRRINSVVRVEERLLAFYDGSASAAENYEERCGLAEGADLTSLHTTTKQEPAYTSPYATGSLRYVDVVEFNGNLHLFYEFARADGAHDLRTIVVR